MRGGILLLAVTRHDAQEIFVGENIIVHVIHVSGNKVKLGIEAPENVPIYREELLAAMQKAGKAEVSA